MPQILWEKDGYILRAAEKSDAVRYYEENYHPLDAAVARLTGSPAEFDRDTVIDFLTDSVDTEDRYIFLLVAPNGSIIGESVLNEIDPDTRSANFRIALFHAADFGKGFGLPMVKRTLAYGFETLQLHRISLEVYSFNPRAKHVYEKAGFRTEGVLRDAVRNDDRYADVILMAILEEEWEKMP